jgi:hypothetical protein
MASPERKIAASEGTSEDSNNAEHASETENVEKLTRTTNVDTAITTHAAEPAAPCTAPLKCSVVSYLGQ